MEDKKITKYYELDLKNKAMETMVDIIIPELEEILKQCQITATIDKSFIGLKITIMGPTDDNNVVIIKDFDISWENIMSNIIDMLPNHHLDLISQKLLDFEGLLMNKYNNPYIFYNDISNPAVVLEGVVKKKLTTRSIINATITRNKEVYKQLIETFSDTDGCVFMDISDYFDHKQDSKYHICKHGIILKMEDLRNDLFLGVYVLKEDEVKKFKNKDDIKWGLMYGDFDTYQYIETLGGEELNNTVLIGAIHFKDKHFQIKLTELLFKAKRITEKYIDSEKDNNQTT